MPLLVVFLPKAYNDYYNYKLAFVGIYFIAILGLNVLTGYNGQISLGHGAFMAIGAYTTAILNVNYGVGLYWTIPIAGILTGLFGFAFGFPALRLCGRLPRARHLRPGGLRPAGREAVRGLHRRRPGEDGLAPLVADRRPDDERVALVPDVGDRRR